MSENSKKNQAGVATPVRTIQGMYDFDVHGGAIGQIKLSDNFGINPGEMIRIGKIFVDKAATSGGSATISFGTTAATPTEFIAATAVASFSDKALLDGIPVPQTGSTWIKNNGTTFMPIYAGIAVAALTAGKIKVIADIQKMY